jgi:hypothetical protein
VSWEIILVPEVHGWFLALDYIRILLIFDPQRRAVLLVAGDKAGNWYRDAIKLAEDRYTRFLATPPEEIR